MVSLLSIVISLHNYTLFSRIKLILIEISNYNFFIYDCISTKIKDKSEC